jgi:hypothetical protein
LKEQPSFHGHQYLAQDLEIRIIQEEVNENNASGDINPVVFFVEFEVFDGLGVVARNC